MPSDASLTVNRSGLIPSSSMPPLASTRPLKPDANAVITAAGDLIGKIVGQAFQDVDGNMDLLA